MYSHFSNGETFIEDYKKFYEKYKTKLDHPFIFGYLIHLMTDNLWRIEMYIKSNDKVIDLNIQKEERNPINLDIEVLTKQIAEHYQIEEINEIDDTLLNELPVIEELPFDGINTTVMYTNYQLTNDIQSSTVNYDLNQIINAIEIVSKLVIEELNNLGK
jgi:hypothetical protein